VLICIIALSHKSNDSIGLFIDENYIQLNRHLNELTEGKKLILFSAKEIYYFMKCGTSGLKGRCDFSSRKIVSTCYQK